MNLSNQEVQPNFESDNKNFIFVAIDRFSIFFSVLLAETSGEKRVVKVLHCHIRIHGIPKSIRN